MQAYNELKNTKVISQSRSIHQKSTAGIYFHDVKVSHLKFQTLARDGRKKFKVETKRQPRRQCH